MDTQLYKFDQLLACNNKIPTKSLVKIIKKKKKKEGNLFNIINKNE
jgi:hypothetical protein